VDTVRTLRFRDLRYPSGKQTPVGRSDGITPLDRYVLSHRVVLLAGCAVLLAARTVWLPCPALPRDPRALSWPRDLNLSGLSCCAPVRLSHYFLSVNNQNHTHAAPQCLPPSLQIFSSSFASLPTCDESGKLSTRDRLAGHLCASRAVGQCLKRRLPLCVLIALPHGTGAQERLIAP